MTGKKKSDKPNIIRGGRYTIEFKGFANLLKGKNYNEIIDALIEPFKNITLGVLKIIEPEKEFVIVKRLEDQNFEREHWPKFRNIVFITIEKDAENKVSNSYADIILTYSFESPQLGDGWQINVLFQHPKKRSKYRFFFYSQNYKKPKIGFGANILEESYLKQIEQFLNEFFNEKSNFVEEEFEYVAPVSLCYK